MPIAFERAADLVANELARYRVGYDVDLVEPRDNERLLAGHIAGRLWANHLLNTAGEKWEDVSFGKITPTIDEASMSKIRKTPSIGMRVEPSMDALKMGFKLRLGTITHVQQKNPELVSVRWDGRQTADAAIHIDLLEEVCEPH